MLGLLHAENVLRITFLQTILSLYMEHFQKSRHVSPVLNPRADSQ